MSDTSALLPRRVFVVWFGGPMPPVRLASLESIRRHVGVEVDLVTEQSLGEWLVDAAPLPPAFGRLSAIHKADYLRCYLMHHHGGGYLDVKPLDADWRPAFDRLDAEPNLMAVGYPEVGRHGVATFGTETVRGLRPLHAAWWRYRWLQMNYRRLVGVCAFVMRPRTALTTAWFAGVSRRLDGFADALAAHPAACARDHAGWRIDGRVSGYPVPWSALLADVLQPLVLEHRRQIATTLPPPRFEGYR